jgi:phosphonate transport system permease protein
MTAAVSPRSRRPPKPRPSVVIPVGIVASLLITWASLSEHFGIGFDLFDVLGDLTRGAPILSDESRGVAQRGLLHPNWAFLPRTFDRMLETFQMAVIASAIGCTVALPIAFLASRITAPNLPTFIADRSVLSVVRAIPDILYALVFVAAVGIGALPGIVALILFNIGVVAKLLSETVDGVDVGPIEASRAGGANRTQTVRWAVLPQVLPHYVAYSLYTFELNIRASTVIGIVGAGGIGYLLRAQQQLFNWSNVSVIVIELFAFVFVIELVSIWLRRRLV